MLRIAKPLSAYEKTAIGLVLSAEDIQQLLKDPNSWLSKLYADLLFKAAIHEYLLISFFIHTVHEQFLLLDQQAEKLQAQKVEKPTLEAKPAKQPEEILTEKKTQEQSLKTKLDDLLQLAQAGMSVAQLIRHHQQITANLNQQLALRLGPSLQIGQVQLTIPQHSSVAIASAARILQHHPDLTKQISTPEMQVAFAKAHTAFELGPLAVLNQYREILLANQQEDLGPLAVLALTKKIDRAYREIQKNHGDLEAKLFENNELLLKLNRKLKSSLSEPPAFYATPKFIPQQKKKVDEEEEQLKKPHSAPY